MYRSLIRSALAASCVFIVLGTAGCAGWGRPSHPPPPRGEHHHAPPPPGEGRHGPPPHDRRPPPDPAFREAFDACLGEQGIAPPAGERPPGPPPALDRERLDACLDGKGIAPPDKGPRPE